MNTQLPTKKEFCLQEIAPYYKDRSLCAYNQEVSNCEYLTPDGKMCVLGKNLIDPGNPEYDEQSATDILNGFGEEILKPEVRGILTPLEWERLQSIHDCLGNPLFYKNLDKSIKNLELFTLQELEDYCQK